MRREKATELVMFGPRITLQRHKRRLIEVVISDESPLVGIRLDDPVLQDIYSATVVGIRPAAHHLAELRTWRGRGGSIHTHIGEAP